jgi:hypothetical protein
MKCLTRILKQVIKHTHKHKVYMCRITMVE